MRFLDGFDFYVEMVLSHVKDILRILWNYTKWIELNACGCDFCLIGSNSKCLFSNPNTESNVIEEKEEEEMNHNI